MNININYYHYCDFCVIIFYCVNKMFCNKKGFKVASDMYRILRDSLVDMVNKL